jgi:hypothetical protein
MYQAIGFKKRRFSLEELRFCGFWQRIEAWPNFVTKPHPKHPEIKGKHDGKGRFSRKSSRKCKQQS